MLNEMAQYSTGFENEWSLAGEIINVVVAWPHLPTTSKSYVQTPTVSDPTDWV